VRAAPDRRESARRTLLFAHKIFRLLKSQDYFGAYASRTRVFRKKRGLTLHFLNDNENATSRAEPELSPKKRTALRKSWVQLIKRVYQIDPLKCECGGTLHVIAFITQNKVIRKILVHLEKQNGNSRAPPKH
jgi:hypothetical protein